MAKELTLSVVAPDRSVVEESVVSVIVPGSEGYFGVLAGHVPLIASLRAGLIEYEDMNGQRHYVTVSGGFAEVGPGNINILADAAERSAEIDISRAERALENARMALRGEVSGVTSEDATAELERAMNRIRAAKLAGG
jgi:F-type H+-transporting ATPase subunit epsilon